MSAVTEPVLPDTDDRLPPAGDNSDRNKARVLYGTLAVIAAIASGVVLLITKHGASMIPDSAVYIGTARNLAQGRGLTTPFNLLINPYSPAKAAAFDGAVPLTHYPPLFPAVLAVFQRLDIDALDAARWFNALLMGVNVFLAGVVAWRFSGGSRVAGVATAVLVAANFNLLVRARVRRDRAVHAHLLPGVGSCCSIACSRHRRRSCSWVSRSARGRGPRPLRRNRVTATAVVVVLFSATLGRGDGTTGRRQARRRRSRYARSFSSAARARSPSGWRCWHSTAPPREHVRWRCTCRAASTSRPASRPRPLGSSARVSRTRRESRRSSGSGRSSPSSRCSSPDDPCVRACAVASRPDPLAPLDPGGVRGCVRGGAQCSRSPLLGRTDPIRRGSSAVAASNVHHRRRGVARPGPALAASPSPPSASSSPPKCRPGCGRGESGCAGSSDSSPLRRS